MNFELNSSVNQMMFISFLFHSCSIWCCGVSGDILWPKNNKYFIAEEFRIGRQSLSSRVISTHEYT